jgi:3-isopropylmalate dehydrogenase
MEHPRDRKAQRIAVLPGDGIGKDVTVEAMKVLEAAGERWSLPIEIEHQPWSADHFLETGVTIPPSAFDDYRDRFAAIFIGAYGDPRVPDMRHAADILLGIRFKLDLYINLRPIKLYDQRLCPLKGRSESEVDFVVFRENTEGAYVGAGGSFKLGTPDEIDVQEEIHTRKGVERILRAAFEYAVLHGRKEVCMSDKSNAMRFSGDLWQRCFHEVAEEYPQIATRHLYIDALTMQMVKAPETFDVVVTNNMFGDIVTDLGAALQGGLGVAGSANIHPGQVSMFEPVHGSAPKYAGTGRANPVGAILSLAMMLEYLGHAEAAAEIERTVARTLRERQTTPDLDGNLSTSEVGDLIARSIAAGVTV